MQDKGKYYTVLQHYSSNYVKQSNFSKKRNIKKSEHKMHIKITKKENVFPFLFGLIYPNWIQRGLSQKRFNRKEVKQMFHIKKIPTNEEQKKEKLKYLLSTLQLLTQ